MKEEIQSKYCDDDEVLPEETADGGVGEEGKPAEDVSHIEKDECIDQDPEQRYPNQEEATPDTTSPPINEQKPPTKGT